MFKEWDRVVANEPDAGIVNIKGTVLWVEDGVHQQLCTVMLDDVPSFYSGNIRCFLQKELTLITNKEHSA